MDPVQTPLKRFSALRCVWLEDGRLCLLAPLEYTTLNGTRYTVPAGFETDLASVPWGFRNLVPAERKTAAPAVLHDWLYYVGPIGHVSRAQADALFYEALISDDESKLTAWTMYLAVRVGGWYAWRNHRKTDDAE